MRKFLVKAELRGRKNPLQAAAHGGTVTIYVDDNGESKEALDVILGVGADGKPYIEARAYADYWRPGMAALKIDLGRED